MPLPVIPVAYTAVASLLARKGATEAAKKYGPKAVKEVQKITAKMKNRPASTEKQAEKLKEMSDTANELKKKGFSKDRINELLEEAYDLGEPDDLIRALKFKGGLLTDDRNMYKDGGGPGIEALRKEAPEVVERMGYEEGGEIDNQMLMVMTPSQESEMEPDSDMEDNYTKFIMEEALSEDEEDMLTSKLEQDEQLSMLFDKIIDVAQEFAGSGPVNGPGSGVSDSIPARLSDGEFVFTAKAVEEIGEDSLMSMMKDAEAKADERQGLAEGGMPEEPKTESLLTQSGIVQEDTIAEDELKKRMVQGSSSYVRS